MASLFDRELHSFRTDAAAGYAYSAAVSPVRATADYTRAVLPSFTVGFYLIANRSRRRDFKPGRPRGRGTNDFSNHLSAGR